MVLCRPTWRHVPVEIGERRDDGCRSCARGGGRRSQCLRSSRSVLSLSLSFHAGDTTGLLILKRKRPLKQFPVTTDVLGVPRSRNRRAWSTLRSSLSTSTRPCRVTLSRILFASWTRESEDVAAAVQPVEIFAQLRLISRFSFRLQARANRHRQADQSRPPERGRRP